MTAVASLESGQRPARPAGPSAIVVAAYVAGAAFVVAAGALLAGFLNLRDAGGVWPPKGVDFDEYLSVMLSATLALSAGFAAWASYAARLGNRRQALAAMIITVGLGLAFLNLAWYTGSHAGFGPASHPFGTIVLAGLALGAFAVATGIGFLLVTLTHTLLRSEREGHQTITAVTRYWILVAVAWMLTPIALYGLMSPR